MQQKRDLRVPFFNLMTLFSVLGALLANRLFAPPIQPRRAKLAFELPRLGALGLPAPAKLEPCPKVGAFDRAARPSIATVHFLDLTFAQPQWRSTNLFHLHCLPQ